MILLDYNQVAISNLMAHLGITKDPSPKLDLVRHMVLNSIRSSRMKFSDKFGDLVICCDDKNFWRRDIFPEYKAHRKKDREKSLIDWNEIFLALNQIREELKSIFPYRVVQSPKAEADDIIAVICAERLDGPTLILSGDKDLIQLQRFSGVEQWSPITKRYLTTDNPSKTLLEHILKGDRSDGIPNFLSDSKVFVEGRRQKTLRSKRLNEIVGCLDPVQMLNGESETIGFHRNKALIDLMEIPENIQTEILEQFDSAKTQNKSKLLGYFIENRLTKLIESIQEF